MSPSIHLRGVVRCAGCPAPDRPRGIGPRAARGVAVVGLLEAVCWALAILAGMAWWWGWSLGQREHAQGLAHFQAVTQRSLEAPAASVMSRMDHDLQQVEGWARAAHRHPATERAGAPDTEGWSSARIADYRAAQAKSAGLAAAAPIGLLAIPKLALQIPVFADTSERNLNRGAGLVHVTGGPGTVSNQIMAAHRDGWFRALKDVALGDEILLQVPGGQRSYRVSALDIVEPNDLSPLDITAQHALTLITCYPFYYLGPAPKRYIVRAIAE